MPFDDFIQFPNARSVQIHIGDCINILPTLPECHFQTCVTSPPYFGLRDYQMNGQLGRESTPDIYVANLVAVFREVRRVLRDNGTIWLNLGDRYKAKDLLGMPWKVAFALQADGWWLRSAIIWHKPNVMPENIKDRPTSAYEMVFLLAKAETYFYDAAAIAEPQTMKPQRRLTPRARNLDAKFHGQPTHRRPSGGTGGGTRNLRNVWSINTHAFSGAHFATMAPELARRCILAGCPAGGVVIDPFGGAGTTGLIAGELGRQATLIELNPDYVTIATQRLGHLMATMA